MKTIRLALYASIVFVLLLSGCNNLFNEPGSSGNELDGTSRFVTSREFYPGGEFLKSETGVLGPGAEYAIFLPYQWQIFPESQRTLIIYAHGYIPPGADFDGSDESALISQIIPSFLETGFAVAFSGYSESGWAVKDGSIRTRQLRSYFLESMGPADDIYLYGASEGALISIKLAEQNPELFSGVLAIAGPLGGSEEEFEYVINSRLFFDHFFRDQVVAAAISGNITALSLSRSLGYNMVPGGYDKSVFDALPDPDFPQAVDPQIFIESMAMLIGGFMLSNPDSALEMATARIGYDHLYYLSDCTATCSPFCTEHWKWFDEPTFTTELTISILTALWYNIYGTNDLLERTRGRIPLDNSGIVYSYTDFNGGIPGSFEVIDVERMESTPDARRYLDHWYIPDGDLLIPVVTLHLKRDNAVPFYHELIYKDKVPTLSPMLTQIEINRFGHGIIYDFVYGVPVPDYPATIAALQNAFNTLVAKVELLSTQ